MRLIDADALKKEWHLGNVCETCVQDTRQCGNDYCFSRMDVCGMIDDAPTVGGWISVKDRMPENDNPVLAWESQGFTYVDNYRKEEKWRKWQIGDCYGGTITHWMPLPEPPKEESDD